jgi:putative ABC transport system substrate-binding protein
VNTTRRWFICCVAAGAVLASARAAGQRADRLPRVALVYGTSRAEITGTDPADPRTRAFVHGLRDIGLIDGRNIVVERRSVDGQPERLPALMREVVDAGVDVIVTFGGPGVRAATQATNRIPIVAFVDNPLDTGVVDSLARPGHNVTGVGESNLDGRRLQILKEIAPTITRVAVMAYRPLPGPRPGWRVELDAAARALRLEIVWVGVDAAAELETALATIVRERADAIHVGSTYVSHPQRHRIADFALKQRLPSIGFPDGVVAGMLLRYTADNADQMRRVAVLVKKILDGAKPADLPFQQPERFTLTINLKTAKALGLTIPQSLLLLPHEFIE